jgi:hypothetical protein
VLTENEILNVVYTLESDNEYSEISDFESDNHPSDGDESESVVTDQQAPQHSRKINRPSAPLFHWDSGMFNPVVHNFDNRGSITFSFWVTEMCMHNTVRNNQLQYFNKDILKKGAFSHSFI